MIEKKAVTTRRRLPKWQAGLVCQGCKVPLRQGESVIMEEHFGVYTPKTRYRIWHPHCSPAYYKREWKKIRRQIRETGTFL
jgi:hypothetical protein